MATYVLPIIFLVAGLLAVLYYRLVPPADQLRQRLPNRISAAALVLTAAIGVGIWLIVRFAATPLLKAAGVTTLLFYLLTFESVLLLAFRWFRSNLLSVIISLIAVLIPFTIQYRYPSFELSNALIVAATLGATTLMIRLNLLRTRIIVLAFVLLTFNDILNVAYVLPRLPLAPYPQTPLPLLIFPTVNVAGRVVGSGDFMFLALATLVILRDLGRRAAIIHSVLQAMALLVTLAATAGSTKLIPYLTVMTPIFLLVYLIGRIDKTPINSNKTAPTS
ncbi:MAG: hypothetical protein HY421_00210 [Candidatus Kerfeldbacteria bacterium]|nr:hypothetical protein [Candidatus Kerfeldbacteria bacterium]